MSRLECPIAESRLKPRDDAPLLTIFVPTFNRTPELVQTIENLAGQLHGGLERKVEILISDNASNAEGQNAIRALADRFDPVSYMFNTVDQGGHFQVFSAPWRARGLWTWVFGSDDLLTPGAIAEVVATLEREAPDFLTMDKRIWNRDLTRELYETTNDLPDGEFSSFIDLFKGVGLHQVAYLGATLERTEAGRRIDAYKYLSADTYHSHTIAYFEKHRDAKCLYRAANPVIRRLDNSVIGDYLGATFEDVGMKFPIVLLNLAQPYGVGAALFEQVNGSHRISSYAPPAMTMVDNIFEYMLRGVSKGRCISYFQRAAFEQMSLSWRAHRRAQFDYVWSINEKMRLATEAMTQARELYEMQVAAIAEERQKIHALSRQFTDKAR